MSESQKSDDKKERDDSRKEPLEDDPSLVACTTENNVTTISSPPHPAATVSYPDVKASPRGNTTSQKVSHSRRTVCLPSKNRYGAAPEDSRTAESMTSTQRPPTLTACAVSTMVNSRLQLPSNVTFRPLVQILSMKEDWKNRFSAVVSDGQTCCKGILATPLCALIHSGELKNNSIVQIEDFYVMQGRNIVVLLTIRVVDSSVGHRIGVPADVTTAEIPRKAARLVTHSGSPGPASANSPGSSPAPAASMSFVFMTSSVSPTVSSAPLSASQSNQFAISSPEIVDCLSESDGRSPFVFGLDSSSAAAVDTSTTISAPEGDSSTPIASAPRKNRRNQAPTTSSSARDARRFDKNDSSVATVASPQNASRSSTPRQRKGRGGRRRRPTQTGFTKNTTAGNDKGNNGSVSVGGMRPTNVASKKTSDWPNGLTTTNTAESGETPSFAVVAAEESAKKSEPSTATRPPGLGVESDGFVARGSKIEYFHEEIPAVSVASYNSAAHNKDSHDNDDEEDSLPPLIASNKEETGDGTSKAKQKKEEEEQESNGKKVECSPECLEIIDRSTGEWEPVPRGKCMCDDRITYRHSEEASKPFARAPASELKKRRIVRAKVDKPSASYNSQARNKDDDDNSDDEDSLPALISSKRKESDSVASEEEERGEGDDETKDEEESSEEEDDEQSDEEWLLAFAEILAHSTDDDEDESDGECMCDDCIADRLASKRVLQLEDGDGDGDGDDESDGDPDEPRCCICFNTPLPNNPFACLPCCGLKSGEEQSTTRFCNACVVKCLKSQGSETISEGFFVGHPTARYYVGECPRCRSLIAVSRGDAISSLRTAVVERATFRLAIYHALRDAEKGVRRHLFTACCLYPCYMPIELFDDEVEKAEQLCRWGIFQEVRKGEVYAIAPENQVDLKRLIEYCFEQDDDDPDGSRLFSSANMVMMRGIAQLFQASFRALTKRRAIATLRMSNQGIAMFLMVCGALPRGLHRPWQGTIVACMNVLVVAMVFELLVVIIAYLLFGYTIVWLAGWWLSAPSWKVLLRRVAYLSLALAPALRAGKYCPFAFWFGIGLGMPVAWFWTTFKTCMIDLMSKVCHILPWW